MSKYKIAEYPQDKFRFALYDNAKKLTRQQIQKETGCYALVNAWYFNLHTFAHDAAFMGNGKWVRPPEWNIPGICIDKDGHVTTGGIGEAEWDYAASVQADYIAGKRVNTTTWGRNGVTYTGLKADGTVVALLSAKDAGLTSSEAVEAMLGAGCVDILRWDGSWSSQGSLGPGLDVQPSQRRICRGWLLIFERETKEDEMGTTKNYMTRNPCYTNPKTLTPRGIMVHSTATPGADANAIRAGWNSEKSTVAVHAVIDDENTVQLLPWTSKAWHCGGEGNNTHLSFEICEPEHTRLLPIEWVSLKRGSKGWAVKRLQLELQARGYDPKGVDGSFGPGCEAALKQCQKALGLTADGSCGPATRAALTNREGSFLQYDPKEVAGYFKAVWDRAVLLCAALCRQFGLDPRKDIICHAEGKRLGIASNHADVEHWFPAHDKTMDDFRAAVAEAMGDTNAVTCPHCGTVFKI